MAAEYLVLDVSSAPLPDADAYLDGTVRAPSNYRDEEKIAAYIAEKQAERLAMAATDVDLAGITGIGLGMHGDNTVLICRTPEAEMVVLRDVCAVLVRPEVRIVTYGGLNFDLPLLMRRARYLGVTFPAISLDRYKSPVIDLCELLSDRNPQRRRSLQFYVKRLGWADLLKPLSGADEALVPSNGRWDELEVSLRHDVEATRRLAVWSGVL